MSFPCCSHFPHLRTRMGSFQRLVAIVAAAGTMIVASAGAAHAQAPEGMCLEGVVSRIEIDNQEIYPVDASQPRLLRWAFGTVNLLHIETTRSFISRELLFKEGDCYDAFVVSESRRLLEEYSFLSNVDTEVSDDGGDKIVRVITRDEWSTQIDVRLQYDNGLNIERFQATEENFLGNGVTAEVTHSEYRERRDRNVRLFTPRFFGRTDADIRLGRSRGGDFFFQTIDHDFAGETSRLSVSEIVDKGTDFYSYATGGVGQFTHVLAPMHAERVEVAAAVRLGSPGRSWILGTSLERTIHRPDGAPEFVVGEDFGGAQPGVGEVTDDVARQIAERGATRVALHLGTRRFRYAEYTGLDAVSAEELISLGFLGSLTIGKSIGLFAPTDIELADDTYTRLFSSLTVPLGQSIIHFSASAEAARADGDWRDLLGQASLIAYGRADWLPNQTLFLRASTGGGWRTTMPFQLSLGGRDGVRSLRDDALPGGRRVYLLAENRIRFGWPSTRIIEVGATMFADAGRVWASDAPFGADTDWVGSVGFGLRIGMPAGSRTIWKPEIAFPLGHDASPVFRVTFEVNRLRLGFGTPRWEDSRRFRRGAEAY